MAPRQAVWIILGVCISLLINSLSDRRDQIVQLPFLVLNAEHLVFDCVLPRKNAIILKHLDDK